MPAEARLDLAVWRNDDLCEIPIRVRGRDLTADELLMEVRLIEDTPGPPLIALSKVASDNAEGLRIAGVTLEGGVPVSDLRLRFNKSSRQGLPYAGELGQSATFRYALSIARRTRLVGAFTVLAHAIGSDNAPTSRAAGYGINAVAGASAGATLTIVDNEVTELVIDGADLLAAERAKADASAVAADASQTEARLARDAALGAVATVQTIAGSRAAFTVSKADVIGGRIDATGRYTSIRTAAGDTVTQAGSIAQAIAASPVKAIFPIAAGASGGRIDSTGRYTRPFRQTDNPLPAAFGMSALVRSLQIGKPPRLVVDQDRALFLSSSVAGAVASGTGRHAFYRIPLLYAFSRASVGGAAPLRRIIAFAQWRDGAGGDYDPSGIAMRWSDDGGATWTAECDLVVTDASWHVDNISCVYDPPTGALEFLGTMTPVGFNEATVPAAGAADGRFIKVVSWRSLDPFGSLAMQDQAGGALPFGFAPQTATVEVNARPVAGAYAVAYWNVCPGSPGRVSSSTTNAGTGELLIAGNASGTAGAAGGGEISTTGFAFLYAKDKTRPAGQQWTWRMPTRLGMGANESALIQRRDGSIMLDCRQYQGATAPFRYRGVVVSDPGVTSWGRDYLDVARPDAQVQGALHTLSGAPGSDEVTVLLACNLRDNAVRFNTDRKNLTVYASTDEGVTWVWALQLYGADVTETVDAFGKPLAAPVTHRQVLGYSSLCRLSGDTFLLLYERNPVSPDGSYAASGVPLELAMLTLNLSSVIRGLLP